MDSSPSENDVSARQKEALSLPLGGEAQLSQEQFTGVGLRIKTEEKVPSLLPLSFFFSSLKIIYSLRMSYAMYFDQMHRPVPPPALLRGTQLLTGFLWVVHWKGRRRGRGNDVIQILQVCGAQTA